MKLFDGLIIKKKKNDSKKNKLKNKNFRDRIPYFKKRINENRKRTQEIAKSLFNQNCDTLFFYTDCRNVSVIINKNQIPVLNDLSLKSNEKYVVWTYQQKNDSIELEIESSPRYFFWKWCSDQQIDPNQTAFIALDLYRMVNFTKKEWTFNLKNNTIIVKENIDTRCIKWIMVQNRDEYNKIKLVKAVKKLTFDLYLNKYKDI